MVESPLPQRLQDLTAGYILGNLDTDELQEFFTLSAQHPDQSAFMAELQALMNQLPFALEEQRPPQALGDRILTAAATQPQRTIQWPPLVIGVAIISAIGLGIDNLLIRQQLRIAQQQVTQQAIALAQQKQASPLQISTSPQVLMANWGGITQILEDHLQAEKKGQQAVEINAKQQSELIQAFKANNLILPTPVPSLSKQKAILLGGAICEFEKTKGVRIMYETPSHESVSFYQLHRASTPSFPNRLSEPLIIQNNTGPNLIVWGNETFLYALVADLPQTTLKDLIPPLEL